MKLLPRRSPKLVWVSEDHEDEPRDQQTDLFGPLWAECGPGLDRKDGPEFWTWTVLDFDLDNAEVAGGREDTEAQVKFAVARWARDNRRKKA